MPPFTYELHEISHLALAPARAISDIAQLWLKSPVNLLSYTHVGKNMVATVELFERMTRRYGKPAFGLSSTIVGGKRTPVVEKIVWRRPFCRLIHFERQLEGIQGEPQPKLLIVAPMSGHHSTLLRGTVEAFFPFYDVYITDWADARLMPMSAGRFDLDDYIDYLISICEHLSKEKDGVALHTLGVCQPAAPLFAAVALMEAEDNPHVPASMTLMGGPIDTRRSPTKVNLLAQERGSAWFQRNCISTVPLGYHGAGREVYPGFLQLAGFMAMNIDRHVNAHIDLFSHLVEGDGDSADKHRDFYDEYLSVMDLTAEFYLQTVDTVFVKHALPKGEMTHHGAKVDFAAIHRVALMTVEGENDDISGAGQTLAAHDLCYNLPASMKADYLQEKVGHYGVFNGSRFRNQIVPRILDFHANGKRSVRNLSLVERI
ncbi:polyhydroxyalkanoate depolymerase [Methylocella tundrae]|uniref:Polyhydroxyalkanoate depolymerase n=1 Tax=Methylocella tundrae TaxID=227605 RepID=A0A4U8YVJ4_METTU|nr:polyhydroxyalkanoate depolymerase [Methylocella tundrae]WPP05054.1 polyhydroxyalkanoate depolymerase [Methylocella tundrae]VFU07354.1 Polyhydroxyalkanoate depolymerase [Methylocella tundrae]